MLAEEGCHKVELMADMLGVSVSGFYRFKASLGKDLPERRLRRQALAERAREVFDQHKGFYGARRVHAQLRGEGWDVSYWLVRKVMREQGLWGRQPRSFKTTTVRAKDAEVRPDLVGRDFTPRQGSQAAPGVRCCGDITYLKTAQGFEYLTTVIDIDTRQVIGMAQADHMRTGLIIQALANAKKAGYLAPGAVFHSDHGSVYTSAAFAKAAELLDVRLSLGRVGVCWDNAVAESFFATLKREMWHTRTWPTRQAARQAVEQWIRGYYNNFRIHSALGTTPRARHLELTANQKPKQEKKVA